MLAVRLPPDLERRLNELAQKTGRTKSYYARAALESYLEDLEDAYLADEALKRMRHGEAEVMSEEDFWRAVDD